MTIPDPDFGSRTDFYTFAPESLASAIPDYEIIREVGKGSMGIVYEARARSSGERVALKVLPPSLTLTERALARFLREGELMQRIEHPSIVRVKDLGRQDRLHYFVMEFVDGVNLERRLEVGPLPIRQAAGIAATVARALHYAHDKGIVHRDVKPSNLILRADETIAITDFGLARETGTGSMTESGAIVGTPMFMAPEQVLGDRATINSRADVYGLGATLYTLITGRPPFTGPTAQSVIRQVLDDDPPRPSRLRHETPRGLEAIIATAMTKDPARRYGSAAEFADDLERFLRGDRVHARLPGPVLRAQRVVRRHPLATTFGVFALVSVVGVYELYRRNAENQLESELAKAERSLSQALGRVDERLRNLTTEARESLLHHAIAGASNVIAMDRDYTRAWFVRAKAEHRLRSYRAAADDLLMAERTHGGPTTEVLLYRIDALSHLYDQASREQLRADLFQLLELDPGDHNRCIVARHLLTMASQLPPGERSEALDKVDRIIDPISVPGGSKLIVLARLLELRGDVDMALETMRTASLSYQGDLLVHTEAAAMFRRNGLDEEGAAEDERARMIDPQFPPGPESGSPAVDLTEMEGFLEDLESLIRAVDNGRD